MLRSHSEERFRWNATHRDRAGSFACVFSGRAKEAGYEARGGRLAKARELLLLSQPATKAVAAPLAGARPQLPKAHVPALAADSKRYLRIRAKAAEDGSAPCAIEISNFRPSIREAWRFPRVRSLRRHGERTWPGNRVAAVQSRDRGSGGRPRRRGGGPVLRAPSDDLAPGRRIHSFPRWKQRRGTSYGGA